MGAGAHQARGDVGHLLAERGRGRWLAVGARQHRQVGDAWPARGIRNDLFAIERRQQHFPGRGLRHQRVRVLLMSSEVQAKVDELGHLHHLGVVAEAL